MLSTLNATFDVISLSETWLTEDNKTIYQLLGYKHEFSIHTSRTGGGVSILLREPHEYKTHPDLSKSDEICESLFLEITNLPVRVIIAAIYRPPGTDLNAFNQYLSSALTTLKNERKLCYLTGDFNVDLLKIDQHIPSSEFCQMLYFFSFLPLITKSTRVTADTASLLDKILIYSPMYLMLTRSLLKSCFFQVSDHFPIFSFHPTILPMQATA
jgi:exonuclease III